MRRFLVCLCGFAAALALKGDGAPSVDLFAGWSPCFYDRYYGCGPYWHDYPSVGVGVPVYGRATGLYDPYGYYGYYPYWGYGYGMRIDLKDRRHALALSEDLLPPAPGEAPTEPHDTAREKQWDSDIETLLGGAKPPEAWGRASATNTPPAKAPQQVYPK